MMNRQTPIGSGFGKHSTADDILAGQNLAGKLAIVTGGHSGLGLETTRSLAKAGARVVVPARRYDAARAALHDLDTVEIAELDLSRIESVRKFAAGFLASGRSIDILINSAGIMACPETRIGEGWEAQFATNHLGHFALVNLLWPAIARNGGARVVSVSSLGHHSSSMRWNDVHFTSGYDKWLAYGQSKTANALFAVHLDRLARGAGVRAFSLHPGKIFTPLQRYLAVKEMVDAGWIDAAGNPADSTFKSPRQGAATQVWAAISPQLDGLGGLYCEDCDIASLDMTEKGGEAGVRPYAADPEQAERLWTYSAELTGVNAFGS